MITINLSEHVINDRAERLALIGSTIGFGEIIKVKIKMGKYGEVKMCLTNTGVTIIKELISDKVITAYACGLKELFFLYGSNRVPQHIYKTVYTNTTKRKFLFEIQKKLLTIFQKCDIIVSQREKRGKTKWKRFTENGRQSSETQMVQT